VTFAFSACCACRRTASTLPLVGTGWQLAQLYGEAVSDLREGSYTLLVGSDGRVSGRGECNRFSGSATRTESSPSSGAMKVGGDIVSTRMMCLTGAEREARYLKILSEFDSYSIDGARLLLIRDGDVLAIFDRAAAPAATRRLPE
jgi:putative lipoprotein